MVEYSLRTKAVLREYPLFFKVKIYSGTDKLKTTKRQLERYIYYVCCNQSHRLYLLGDTRLLLHLQKSRRSKEKVRLFLMCFLLVLLLVNDLMSGKTTDARFSSLSSLLFKS